MIAAVILLSVNKMECLMGTYCWIAVEKASPSIFVDTEVYPGSSFSFKDCDSVSVIQGDDFGVSELSTGWALLMFTGDCIESSASIQAYADAFGSGTRCVVLNMASSVMCSDFSLFFDSKLRCSVRHNGCDHGVMHFEKHGRLPNGGRKVVSEQFDSQKGVTDTDYIFSIAEKLGELITGFRVEGSLPLAKPIDGFRLLE